MVNKRFFFWLFTTLFVSLLSINSSYAQKGKLVGQVVDAKTGEPLPGVNVLVEGTTIGTATDIDGYYTIININAGIYAVRFSYVGYAPYTVQDVSISVGLTTEVNAKISEEVFQGEEVVVRAERPVVQVDMSSSQSNLSSEDIKNMPITSVTAAVGLQAGVEGLTIRGGGSDEIAFNVNGLTMRDERTNQPLTNISFTSISNIQVQTGGFNAEYGNIRSGLINVTTKEGSKDKYEVDALVRYTPIQKKHIGEYPNDPNSYFIRPFLDPSVAWTGTDNGNWDPWLKRQYVSFPGWYRISENLRFNSDPTDDLSPEAAQQAFMWQYRKSFEITNPDYDIDLNIGGPVFGISKMLGDLRFNFSMRKTQTMYFIPLATDRYETNSYMLKLTSDVAKGMKLSVEGMMGSDNGTSASNTGSTGFFVTSSGIASDIQRTSYDDARTFSDFFWAPSTRSYYSGAISFTHTLSPTSFYELRYSNVTTSYETNPGKPRDLSPVFSVGGVDFDEAPFGYYAWSSAAVGSGMRMGVGMSTGRDSSFVSVNTVKMDYTNQVNRLNQVKAGFEFVHTASQVNYARVDSSLSSGNTFSKWDQNPLRFSAYIQDKIEFKGMIANLGVRMDVSAPSGEWYDFSPYDDALGTNATGLDTVLNKKSISPQVNISPRLGVSFPVTVKSKLFFNYGHFYSMPSPENLYLVRFVQGNQVRFMANPNLKLPKTVAYEIGFEQDLFDEYLMRISGYYQDVSQQPASITYISRNGLVNYSSPEANSYRDVRGLELTFQKVKGKYFRFLANYTYRVSTSGLFNFQTQYELPAQQREYERNTTANNPFRPIPTPFARLVFDFFTPKDFGPSFAGFKPFESWSLNLINSWRAGGWRTWTGGGSVPNIVNNVQDVDTYNTDLRFSKDLRISKSSRINFYLDISNLFNLKYLSMSNAGFAAGTDFLDYMRSLHMPERILNDIRTGYDQMPIAGNDRPGVYRKPGVDFVPIVTVSDINSVTQPYARPLYYDYVNDVYYRYENGQMVVADAKFVDQVYKDKAYIDMPNISFLNFLNPRTFRLGFRISF
ncbi:TonB-dependent receptor [bacterium]|nr:MAG: TonB-dependent receptor [bacterium]